MSLARTSTGLEAVKVIAKLVPIVGSSLEGLFDLLILGCKAAQDVDSNKEASKELSDRAALLCAAIVRELQKMDEDTLKRRLGDVNELLLIAQKIVLSNQRRINRNPLKRFWHKSGEKEEIEALSDRLNQAIERFGISSLVSMKGGLDVIVANVTKVRADQIQMQETQKVMAEKTLLDTLKPINEARHDVENAPPSCLKNTRETMIQLLMDWATGNTEDFIFWLSGLGGTGKTTVVRTVCDELSKLGILGAAFFASRSSAERRNGQNIVRSIVHQLAHFQPHMRSPICDILQKNPMIVEQSMSMQIPAFLSEALSVGAKHLERPIVLVIDALDECNKDESGREGGSLLPLLYAALQGVPNTPVKLLITSRLEGSIQMMFSTIKSTEFRLHNIERSIVRTDILLYLEYSFLQIAERYSQLSHTQWPGPPPEVVVEITDRAGGLFIFAATVVKYVGNPRYSPAARLASFLSHSQRHELDSSPSPYDDLDSLYTHVLRSALGDDPRYHGVNGRRIRQLLGVLFVLFEPLSVASLARLLGWDEGQLRLDLEPLSAVILVPEQGSDETIHFFHTSFQDYLSDQTRCTEVQFWIDTPKEFHDLLATRCCDILLDHRRTNVLSATESQNADGAELEYARSYNISHARWSDMATIKKLVNLYRELMDGCESQHPDYEDRLMDYSQALEVQINCYIDPSLLDESIVINRKVLELRPRGHPRRDDSLNNLAIALQSQFNQTGENELLAEAIRLHRESLVLRPRGHPSRDDSLDNLAITLKSQFDQTGENELLAEAIRLHRESMELRPRGHPRRDSSLNNLAVALQSQFNQTGEDELLAEVICLHRESLKLCPRGHPSRDSSLNNLAITLKSQFNQTGKRELLAEVIRLHRESMELRPRGHPSRDSSLNNLAIALQSQFNQTGDNELLAEVVRLHRESLELCPRGHPYRDYSLNNLANALQSQFDQTGKNELLAEAICLHRESLELHSLGHPHCGTTLYSFSITLHKQFEQNNDISVLEEALHVAREAHQILGLGHRYHQSGLTQLASLLEIYARVSDNIEAAREAERLRTEADQILV